jgi:hypothetical protein
VADNQPILADPTTRRMYPEALPLGVVQVDPTSKLPLDPTILAAWDARFVQAGGGEGPASSLAVDPDTGDVYITDVAGTPGADIQLDADTGDYYIAI